MPDFEDERYWRQFEKNLWNLLRKQKPVSPNKIENCFTFARCREIADALNDISDVERQHLGKCHYCESRVRKFAALESAVEKIKPVSVAEKSFIQKLTDFFRPQPLMKPAFAAFGLLCVVAFFGWLIFTSIRQQSVPDDVVVVSENSNQTEFSNNDPNKTTAFRPTNQISNMEDSLNILTPHPISPDSNAGENTPKPETPDELEGVPANERETVIAALKTGELSLPEDDVLFQPAPVVRGSDTKTNKPKPTSPVNRAVTESKPILSWQGAENTEYVVTVTDRARREIAKSGTLKQTSWQVSKPLASGLYFWIVTAKKADSEKPVESSAALFKVISGREKENLETSQRKIESPLAKAVIYFRAGLFDEAERELQIELKKNPNSRRAKSFLRQVRETKQKLKSQENQL